jgi:activator of 2-hydroxyglutaryl-CoA dehydratase
MPLFLIIGFGIDCLIMKNIGVCEKLREELAPKKVNLPDEPQIAGALGAAIIAKKHVASCMS